MPTRYRLEARKERSLLGQRGIKKILLESCLALTGAVAGPIMRDFRRRHVNVEISSAAYEKKNRKTKTQESTVISGPRHADMDEHDDSEEKKRDREKEEAV